MQVVEAQAVVVLDLLLREPELLDLQFQQMFPTEFMATVEDLVQIQLQTVVVV